MNEKTKDIDEMIEEDRKRFTEKLRNKWKSAAKECRMDDGSLVKFMNELVKFDHTYSSAPYAMACAALAAAWAIEHSPGGGMTGFQWGHGAMRALQLLNYENNKLGIRVQNYDNILYPQYEHMFTGLEIDEKHAEEIKKAAEQKLKESPNANENVLNWWKALADGWLPQWIHVKYCKAWDEFDAKKDEIVRQMLDTTHNVDRMLDVVRDIIQRLVYLNESSGHIVSCEFGGAMENVHSAYLALVQAVATARKELVESTKPKKETEDEQGKN
jgi:hypothetical protein